MKLRTIILSLSIYIFSVTGFAEKIDPNIVMKNNFLSNKVVDSQSESEMKLINSSKQERVRKMFTVTKLSKGTTDNQRYVKFLSPADIKGTATLLIEKKSSEDDLWIYLPAMKKVRRLASADKKSAFVGSDFTFGDILGHKPEDWTHKYLKSESISNNKYYIIESVAKSAEIIESTGYSKRISWIDAENYSSLKTEFYNSSGEKFKIIKSDNIKNVDPKSKKFVAMTLTSENLETKHKTIISFLNYKANSGVSDSYFKSQSLNKDH